MSDDELIEYVRKLAAAPKVEGVQTVLIDRGHLRRLVRLVEFHREEETE